jgi:hypothetical protein
MFGWFIRVLIDIPDYFHPFWYCDWQRLFRLWYSDRFDECNSSKNGIKIYIQSCLKPIRTYYGRDFIAVGYHEGYSSTYLPLQSTSIKILPNRAAQDELLLYKQLEI